MATNELRFLYHGWNLIATLNSELSTLNSFVWGLDLSGSFQGAGGIGGLLWVNNGSASTHFVSYDSNGNVTALVNAADGSESARYEYGPFGEVIRASGPAVGSMVSVNPFRFSTKYQDDETDLLYYGYRYYNPSTGRWLSRDPIEERGGLNLYGFVSNSQINVVDDLGLCPCKCKSVKGGPPANKINQKPHSPGQISVGMSIPWKVTVEGDINKCHCRYTDNGDVWITIKYHGGPTLPGHQSYPAVGRDIDCTYEEDRPGGIVGVPSSGSLTYDITYSLTVTLVCYDEGSEEPSASDSVSISGNYKDDLTWP